MKALLTARSLNRVRADDSALRSRGPFSRLSVCALLLLMLSSLAWSCQGVLDKHYVVATFEAGKGRSIIILADREVDAGQGFFYEVRIDEKVVVPKTFFEARDGSYDLDCKLISDRRGQLFAVVEKEDPQRLLLIHDFESGRTWPRCFSEPSTSCREKGHQLLAQLQQDYPNTRFLLNGD